MSTWPDRPLGQVLADATPGFACGEDVEDGVFQFRMNNITTEGQIDLTKRRRVPGDYRNIDRFHVQPGDVLFNATNSPDLVGKTAYFPGLEEPAVFSNHFLRLRPQDGLIDGRYLTRWLNLQFLHGRFKGMCRQWVNQATVGRDALLSLRIPLPPLPEQRRIAEILDKADALRAKRRAALAQLDILTQSIFLDMFGDPATNPKGVRKAALGDLIRLKSGDFLPASEMAPGGTFPVLGGNGINGYHDRYMFEEPQIVIGRVGAYCGCVHAAPPRSWITDNALYVSERAPELRFEYLTHALTHARLNQYASQSGQPLISGSRIYPVAVLVPPEELQVTFEERVASVGFLARLYDSGQSAVDGLFASLQHRAFRGEL